MVTVTGGLIVLVVDDLWLDDLWFNKGEDVSSGQAAKVVETVVVEKPIEVPIPQTVIFEIERTVEVPITKEVIRVETVLVEKIVATLESPPATEKASFAIATNEGGVPTVTLTLSASTPAATAVPTATPAPAMAPKAMEEDVEIMFAIRRVSAVIGLPTIGPYAGTPTHGGGVEEYFYHFENGDPMTPELVESWDIDPAGTRVSMTMRQHPDGGGIPFNPPAGYEDLDFGVVDADSVVRYFNESNATTNPDTTYGNSGDLAAIFLEAKKIDDRTVEIGLVRSRSTYCLPISQFGCLERGARSLLSRPRRLDGSGMGARAPHRYRTRSCKNIVSRAIDARQRLSTGTGASFLCIGQVHAGPGCERTTLVSPCSGTVKLTWQRWTSNSFRASSKKATVSLETMPGGFVGQSILFPGLLWEHSHARTG